MKTIKTLALGALFVASTVVDAQVTNVEFSPTVKRSIGGVSTLDRDKYFKIHSALNDAEMQQFYKDYNVNLGGRQFWGAAAYAKNKTSEVGVYPANKTPQSGLKPVEHKVLTEHPYSIYKEGISTDALASWVVEYFQNHYNGNRPKYYEPMNEPFVHAKDFYDEPNYTSSAEVRVKREMTECFAAIGAAIHAEPDLAGMKMIGYASAYPSLERKDFSLWETNWKMFIDNAGDQTDALAVHLYDGINVVGQDSKRSGSNIDAILDLLETYTYQKFNKVIPFAIDEYGGIADSKNYDDFMIEAAQSVRSQNSILFQLLDRPDRVEMSIPFCGDKSTWHITEANDYLPYGAVLLVDQYYVDNGVGRPLNEIDQWAYTDKIYYYELFKNFSGDRVEITTDNPDVMVQAFVSDNKLLVGLNYLGDDDQEVSLSMLGNLPALRSVLTKSLIVPNTTRAVYDEQTTSAIPASVTLSYGQTVVYECTFDQSLVYDDELNSERYYADSHLKAIVAQQTSTFHINKVKTSVNGYATLNMSIGRSNKTKTPLSKQPVVLVNGNAVTVPNNWKGYDQGNRDDFFGNIEIPVDMAYLVDGQNTVKITFDDNGGHISSVILDVALKTNVITSNKTLTTNDVALSIVPNPASGSIHLQHAEMNSLVSIYAYDGKLVKSEFYTGEPIDISTLKHGIYWVKAADKVAELIVE